MRHFCTYFDTNYLLRGLTMFRSLQTHGGEFVMWALCCDDASYAALQKLALPNLRPVTLRQIEAFEPALLPAKANRTFVEYLWTLSPIWPLYLLDVAPEIEMITYLDADLFFFASPQPIFDEIGANSIALFGHRFPAHMKDREVNGIYNVGWLSFRRDEHGLACLNRWKDQCLEWCYDRNEGGRYGDQKYLDEWPQLWPGVRVIEHEGAGVAPWNWQLHRISRRADQIYSNEVPLIFFHFHGLRILNSRFYDAVYGEQLRLPTLTRKLLFGPYLKTMIETARWARAAGCKISFGYTSPRQYISNYGTRLFLQKIIKKRFVFHAGLR